MSEPSLPRVRKPSVAPARGTSTFTSSSTRTSGHFKSAGVAPTRLVEYALAIKGTRRISTGGAWYGSVKDEDLEVDASEAIELLTFQVLLLRAGTGDEWAIAVKKAVDAWIARRFRNLPEEILRRLLPNASVH